ncbi:abortive infection family protein, partial [Burkholderia gladioli]|uniref:abortive infection family protein n=1 Tax=Burkholderia gladioli TaxID=28095 RepID=UPI001ABA56AC
RLRFMANHLLVQGQVCRKTRSRIGPGFLTQISDPEGAITSARTLLESVCKHILDELFVGYGEAPDLNKLYGLTAKALNLSPSQHTEPVFKQILGGCTSVVEGLGAVRNRLSDSHGKGKVAAKPAARHAELAVNLSGSVALFLLATLGAQVGKE